MARRSLARGGSSSLRCRWWSSCWMRPRGGGMTAMVTVAGKYGEGWRVGVAGKAEAPRRRRRRAFFGGVMRARNLLLGLVVAVAGCQAGKTHESVAGKEILEGWVETPFKY